MRGDDFLVGHLVFFHVLKVIGADRTGVGGDGLGRFGVGDEMRQHLVLDLDGAERVFGGAFIDSGDSDDFVASPENLHAWALDDFDRFHARHFFRGAGINADDFGVGVRTAQDFAGQQSLRVVVVGIFRAAGGLGGAIDAINTSCRAADGLPDRANCTGS